jgi:pimeloyl-ACP methyl ester carboxylesterase
MQMISVDDVRLEDSEAGEGSAVVLLHGIPTRNVLWRDVTSPLVYAGYRVIAPDLAGFGRSDAPAEVEIQVGNQATWMWKLRARYWRGRRADHDGSGSRESTIE